LREELAMSGEERASRAVTQSPRQSQRSPSLTPTSQLPSTAQHSRSSSRTFSQSPSPMHDVVQLPSPSRPRVPTLSLNQAVSSATPRIVEEEEYNSMRGFASPTSPTSRLGRMDLGRPTSPATPTRRSQRLEGKGKGKEKGKR
jgi:hypothetical protein